MSEIKWIDAREFKEEGFLQEANRQFFHPHGLALAITRITDDDDAGPVHTFALTAEQYTRLTAVVADDEDLAAAVGNAARYDVGDAYFQGVWDFRDDPEGVIFGSWGEGDRAKVERVAAERERHREARKAMFGGYSDVEPLDYRHEEQAA